MNFSQAKIKYIIIHEIGSKLRDEKVFLSSKIQLINRELEKILLDYFLKPFMSNSQELLNFHHNSNLNLNEVYSYSKSLFRMDNEISFIEASKNIAKHLYEYTLHPRITRGELIIVEISNIAFNNEKINLIGIFKSENKDSFLKFIISDDFINIKNEQGINLTKIEKGCLILNVNSDNGFVVLNIDNNSQHTDYWTNKFLNLKPINNDRHKTQEIMKICRNFADEVLSKKYDIDTEITFNNVYISYFEDVKSFDFLTFNEMILQNEDVRKDFYEYKESNEKEFEFDFNDKFDVSSDVVKKEKKKIKNVIKLDTKLELKILLDKENGTKNIEKGFDEERGMSYYKIYFNEEIN